MDKTNKRIRGEALQKLRRRIFREHPLCVSCQQIGKVREAKELDHIIPLFKGGSDDDDNLQGLCVECHRKKSAADLGIKYKPPIGVDGWPENF
jgi:5-methylcytosine-specific restriction protein A